MQFGTLIMLPRTMASANMAFFMAGLVREASSVNIVLQISSRDIENEVAKIVTEQRKVSPECSGTTKALDADDPQGDGLQVSVGINLLAHAAANPQPPPLVAGQVEVNEAAAANPQPPPLVAGKVKVNEAAVAVTKDYYIYRMESYVPRNVTCVRIHCSVKFIQYLSLRRDEGHWAHAFDGCKRLIEVVLHTSTRLSCALLRLVPSLAYFHTTPSSYASILDFALLKWQLLYFSITRYGSMKYLIFAGIEYLEFGACVSRHSHFRSHASPFHATSIAVSDGRTILESKICDSRTL